MMRFTFFFHKFKYFDLPLLAATLLLCLAGLAVLYSTSLSNENTAIFWKQLLFLSLGLLIFIFFSFFDYHALAKANRIIYPLFLVLLIYLLFFGPQIRGGRRWLPLGFTNIQLAEFVKITVILGLARLLYFRRGQINSWQIIFWSLFYAGLPAFLILLEPDFGSAVIIIAIWLGILLFSKIKKKFLIVIFIALLAVSGITWRYFLKDFQKSRIMVFIDPKLDPKGQGYNVKQATIAVGSGQLMGKGLAKGLQTQNKFLPERQTDFIFAAAAEEAGFLGAFFILLLYFFLFYRLIKITRRARDDLGMYLAGGVFFLLFFHTIINIGMNIGLLPVTGIPLPFFSAGGSFLIAILLALGIAQNIAMQSKILRF
ncbi:MAG: rod shape-determining protein RodA [Candidatus Doudnabacteria bacterium]|nr:rod shape-determining protein RodA [Candidatus Doudnabacteria bacterium]